MLKFLWGKPALLCGNTLVLADLHLGIEHELFGRGIRMAPRTKQVLGEILGLLADTGVKRLLLLGDVKHEVRGIPHLAELSRFFQALNERADVGIVRGNHDGGIEKAVGSATVHGSGGVVVNGVAFCHGNAWPSAELMRAGTLVLAHSHPVIEFRDRFGYRHAERAWIDGALDCKKLRSRYETGKRMRCIVMPAFSELVGGIAFNADAPLGPLFASGAFKLDGAKATLLNGVCIGSIAHLRRFA